MKLSVFIFFYLILNFQQIYLLDYITLINMIQMFIFYITLKLHDNLYTKLKIILHIISIFISMYILFDFNYFTYIIACIVLNFFELFSKDIYNDNFIYYCIISELLLNAIKIYYDTYQIGLHFFNIKFINMLSVILLGKNIIQLNTEINNITNFKTIIKLSLCILLFILYFNIIL